MSTFQLEFKSERAPSIGIIETHASELDAFRALADAILERAHETDFEFSLWRIASTGRRRLLAQGARSGL